MDYGIVVPTYIDMWLEVQAAEDAGFTHAWFPDSQLIWSDCYAAMALAAERTSRITLGTLVSIPSNRIAPVTASAIATINKLAPGRVILTLGTGYTGRNTMGLPCYPVADFRDYAQQVRGLLSGDDVLFREGDRERWIRLIHPDHPDFINLHDPIPIFLAANGKAMRLVGELGDGWVTSGGGPRVADGFPLLQAGRGGRPRVPQAVHRGARGRLRAARGRNDAVRPRPRARRPLRDPPAPYDVGSVLRPLGRASPHQRRRPRRGISPLHQRLRRGERSPRRPPLSRRPRRPLQLPQGSTKRASSIRSASRRRSPARDRKSSPSSSDSRPPAWTTSRCRPIAAKAPAS